MFQAFRKAGLAVALAAAAASTATPASASVTDPVQIMASSHCVVGSSGNCTTGVVGANSTGRYIDYYVNNRLRPSPCGYRLRDVNSRVVVGSGTVGAGGFASGRVRGLVGNYQLELRGCSISAVGGIDNE
jgi:hypothetical protein